MVDGHSIPDTLAWLIIAGAVALALFNLGKVARALRLDGMVMWLGRQTQTRIIAPAQADIDRIDEKLDALMEQLTSANGGSIREQVNTIANKQRQDSEALWLHIADESRHHPDPDDR